MPPRGLRMIVIVFALVVQVAAPALASASTSGPCVVSGSAGPSTIDLGALEPGDPWHVRSSDRLTVEVTAPFAFKDPEPFEEQAGGVTTFYMLASLGIMDRYSTVPWGSGTIREFDLTRQAILGPRFGMGAAAYGAADEETCSWFVDIVLEDVSPLLTVFGGGALLAGMLCIAGVLLAARRGRGWPARLIAAALGGVAGAALFSATGQFGLIGWDEQGGFAAVGVGLIIGLMAAGRLRSTGFRRTS